MMSEVKIYQELGLSFFPLPHGKKESAIAWKQYQEHKPTDQEIEKWFSNETKQNIAIVCGAVSGNLVILDADSEERFGELAFIIEEKTGTEGIFNYTLVSSTGKGYHIWLFVDELPPSMKFPKLDIKSEGGYIVAPPSLHPSGKEYKFLNPGKPIQRIKSLLDIGIDLNQRKTETLPNEPDNWVSRAMKGVGKGERDDTCAKLAGYYLKKLPMDIVKTVLYGYADKCTPPFSHQDVDKVINSIAKKHPAGDNPYADNKDIVYTPTCPPLADTERYKSVTKSVTKGDEGVSSVTRQEVEDWIKATTAWWSYEELDKELGINTPTAKQNRRIIIHRLLHEDRVIESHPSNNKLFRFINTSVRLIDFRTARGREPIAIQWPFGIERYYQCRPGNIIVCAGAADAGKTALLLNIVRSNMENFPIYYQSSEMGEDELANRLEKFEGIDLNDWNFTPEERSSNFADAIRPDCINIIDYMEFAGGEYYLIADYLKQIHAKLNSGIAIVAIQKKRGAEIGRGGEMGLEKPRLYLSMDAGKITIQKCKNWAQQDKNPNRLVANFKIVGGCRFIVTRDWYKEDDL